MEVNEESSKTEMQKVRNKLRAKLKLQPQNRKGENMEELKLLKQDTERQIEKKLFHLTNGLRESSAYLRHKHF
jgi:F0F1-type ATP synthase membrane subunit b/b'